MDFKKKGGYFSFKSSSKRSTSSRYWAAWINSNFLAASCISLRVWAMLFSNCSRDMTKQDKNHNDSDACANRNFSDCFSLIPVNALPFYLI